MKPLHLLLVPLLIASAGCGPWKNDALPEGPVPAPDRCEEIFSEEPKDGPPEGATVLLADGSASGFTREDASERKKWDQTLAERFPTEGNRQVRFGVFGGDVDWRIKGMTPAASKNEKRTQEDMEDARSCFNGKLAEALKSPPREPQTDILDALAEAADQVRSVEGRKSIYIATDGLSNTGCADLNIAPIGDHTAIPGIVERCGPELPELDKEFRVGFLGIGHPGKGWPDVKTPHRDWLVALWEQLCKKTGAVCDRPVAADPDDGRSTVEGELPADAEITVPEIKVKAGTPTVLTVPASILFDVDSADLATERAQEALDEILAYLDGIEYKKVEVAGHTDSTGTPAHNRDLSQRRAEAVRRALAARGVTGLTATGYGEKQPQPGCTPEIKNGVPDFRAMACNRRVEIIVHA